MTSRIRTANRRILLFPALARPRASLPITTFLSIMIVAVVVGAGHSGENPFHFVEQSDKSWSKIPFLPEGFQNNHLWKWKRRKFAVWGKQDCGRASGGIDAQRRGCPARFPQKRRTAKAGTCLGKTFHGESGQKSYSLCVAKRKRGVQRSNSLGSEVLSRHHKRYLGRVAFSGPWG